jgi:O-antigen/teichoic acid export membrane protein
MLRKAPRIWRNTGWMTLAQGGQLVIQAVYFVLIARALGASGFGAFAAALALVSILSPLAALGTGNLLVMHVARRPGSFGRYWGNALLAIPVAGVPLLLLSLVGAALLVPNLSPQIVAALGFAEFFMARLVDSSAQAFQAFERMLYTAVIGVLPSACRLGAAAVFVAITPSPGPVEWSYWYLAATIAAAGCAFITVDRVLGRPKLNTSLLFRHLKEGVYFSLAQSSANVYNDIDKTMLARLATLDAAGVYAAAYRATAVAFVPVSSMLNSTYARFFQRGTAGVRGSLSLARELLPFAVIYGLGASALLFLAAPVAPHVLGADYADSVGALRWLSPLPAILAWYYLAGDTLTGANRQGIRTAFQLAAACLNVALNIWLIPQYSWKGAAWATLASMTFLAVGLWVAVRMVLKRSPAEHSHDHAHPGLARVQ